MDQKVNRLRRIIAAAVMLLALTGFYSCEKFTYTPPAVDPNTTWKLSTDIQPIFNASCVSCHGGSVPPDLRETKSFNALTRGAYVDAPAESSKLYKIMEAASHLPRSTETERLKVLYWITQGAKNN